MKRSNDPEWIDLGPPYYTSKEYDDCLYQLDRIGRYLGGDRATFWALEQLQKPFDTILDVGCGGGLFALRLGKRYPTVQITGTDLSPEAISFAKHALQKTHPLLSNVSFALSPTAELNYPSASFDIVMATLVCHHLDDESLVEMIRKSVQIARQAVILNDLHRHLLALGGFALLVPFLFPNRLIWHDGLLSIRKSFTRKEWEALLQKAEIPPESYSITWHWPFRWIVQIIPK
ncbi:MAG: methyltransferase domain-containing protein [Candidatus Protochlamydia sp.]|nr:methyltransferase domain-containing protein [Candidatus Protochlamydia sp.]